MSGSLPSPLDKTYAVVSLFFSHAEACLELNWIINPKAAYISSNLPLVLNQDIRKNKTKCPLGTLVPT